MKDLTAACLSRDVISSIYEIIFFLKMGDMTFIEKKCLQKESQIFHKSKFGTSLLKS